MLLKFLVKVGGSDVLSVQVSNSTAGSLRSIDVTFKGSKVTQPAVVPYDGMQLDVSPDSVLFAAGESQLEIRAARATKFTSEEERVKHMHLDLSFPRLDTKGCTAG
eukprot:gene2234-10942_t